MATVGEAVAALGLDARDGAEVIIVRPEGGRWAHYRLADVASKPINGDIYGASGLFLPGTVSKFEGRRADNLAQIAYLPFDIDLKDWLPAPLETVVAMPQAVIDDLIVGMQGDVEEVFAAIGLPIHLMEYTGHGLALGVRLPPHLPETVPAIKALHGRIVDRINAVARLPLLDSQVKDAGTRLMRLPGSTNTKSDPPRTVRVIYRREGVVDEAMLLAAAGGEGATVTPPPRVVPKAGSAFDAATERQIVEALRPHWTEGARHRLALALGGLFGKAGVPEEQTARIVATLAAGDAEANDRLKAVATSYERVRSGLVAQGFHGLAATLPPDLVTWLDEHAGRVRAATGPRVAFAEPTPISSQDAAIEYAPIPDACLVGWIGDYVRLMLPTTEAPAAFHYGVGMTLAGATIGRRVGSLYGSDPLFANLYTLLVGRSGRSRKDTAIKRATRLLTEPMGSVHRAIRTETQVSTDVGSAEGLVKILEGQPNTLLYLTEFSRLINQARRKGTSTIIPILIEAFDTPPVLQNLNKASPTEARYPYLSIISATQPDILAGLMADDDIHSGFANRWFYVCGNGIGPLPSPPALDRAVAARLYVELWDAVQHYDDGMLLTMSGASRPLWDEWYCADYRRTPRSAEEDSMRVRHAVLIQKLALIYAVATGAKAIEPIHLDPAVAALDWMWRHVEALMPTWGNRVESQIESRVLAVLGKRGALRRRELAAACSNRKWSSVEFNRVLDAMKANGTILVDPAGVVGLPIDG